MSMAVKPLQEMLRELPSEARREVEDFTSYLWERYGSKSVRSKRSLKLDWRGGLKELRDKYTSVDLQHKIRDWWDDDASR